MAPQMIRSQKRTNEQHRGSGSSNQVRQKRTESKKDRIDERRSSEFTFHVNSTGNDEQRAK